MTLSNNFEFEQALGVGDGQGGLACCRPCGHRVRHNWATEQLCKSNLLLSMVSILPLLYSSVTEQTILGSTLPLYSRLRAMGSSESTGLAHHFCGEEMDGYKFFPGCQFDPHLLLTNWQTMGHHLLISVLRSHLHKLKVYINMKIMASSAITT